MKLSLLALVTGLLLVGCDLPETTARADDKANTGKSSPSPATNAETDAPASGATNAAVSPSTNTPATAIAPPLPVLPPNLPEAAREVVKLAHTQVGDGVLTNFIANLKEPFELDAEQIVYLRDLGITPAVIESLLVRQQQLGSVARANPPTTATSPDLAAPPTPNAQATLSTTNTPTVYPGAVPDLPPPQVSPAETVATTESPVNTEPQPVVNNYNYFYDSLAPYGNWITVPSYGYVWQPTCAVVGPSWRPYWNNGSWLWSDCGWYWNSCYSWGWAPFHYGNWCNAPGYGWCWAPGSTWGPSWVTFRYATGYCGWAPLPPGCGWRAGVGLTWAGAGIGVGFNFGYSAGNYCWTPTSYFAHPNCWNYGVNGKRVEQLFKDSTVINNYIVGNNNTIINNGIDPGNIQKHSRSEIRKVQLADAPSSAAAGGLAAATARPEQTGRLPVYRPTVSSSVGSVAPASNVRSEARPTQLASQTRTAPDRFSLPARPTMSGASDSGAPARINIPAGSPNPTGSAVAPHNDRRGPGTSSATVASLPARGTVPTYAVRGSQSSGSPVVVPSRSNPSSSPGAYTPYTATQSPVTGIPGRTEPRKPISSSPTPSSYQPVQPGTSQGTSPGSGSSFRPNYGTPMPSRSSAPNYQSPSFSRPQSSPIPQGAPSRPSFNSGPSFNSAPRAAPSSGGGSGGSTMGRPGGRP